MKLAQFGFRSRDRRRRRSGAWAAESKGGLALGSKAPTQPRRPR